MSEDGLKAGIESVQSTGVEVILLRLTNPT